MRRATPCRAKGYRSGGCAPERVRAVATLLEHLVTKEVECKALGAEVLHLYREINLIYSFSEKLATLLAVERVADLTLREARHLIVATDGAVMLLEDDGALATVAGFGDELPGRWASAAASASSAPSPRAASARSSTTSMATAAASPRARGARSSRCPCGWGAGHRRAGARQHGADALHRRAVEAAEHAGIAGGHRHRERAALRAYAAGGGRTRAPPAPAQGNRSGQGRSSRAS